VARGIETPGELARENRAVDDGRRDPVGIDHPCDRADVPDHFRPGIMIRVIFCENLIEIIADRALPFYVPLHFRDRRAQMLGHVLAGDVNKWHTAVEYDPRRVKILTEIELRRGRPVERIAAKPDDDDFVDDASIQQNRGGHIRNRPDREHVKRSFTLFMRTVNKVLGGIAPHGLISSGHIGR